MKNLIVALLMCAGVLAQDCNQKQPDSLLVGMLTIYSNQALADTTVYYLDTNYVSVNELIEALDRALSYTKEDVDLTLPYIQSPAQKLRDMADKLEQKENDLTYLRILLNKAKRYYGKQP